MSLEAPLATTCTRFTDATDAERAIRRCSAVVRIICGYCRSDAGGEVAVALVGGDKTTLGNNWNPPHISEAQSRLDQYWRQYLELTLIVKRGNR